MSLGCHKQIVVIRHHDDGVHQDAEARGDDGEAVDEEVVELGARAQQMRSTQSAVSDHDGHARQKAAWIGHVARAICASCDRLEG